MHRVSHGNSDWANVPPEERNPWQQRAAATYGIVTPGNQETVEGFLASSLGLELLTRDSRWARAAGVALLAVGRNKDLKDGRIADKTGTKSNIGAGFDAVADTRLTLKASPKLAEAGIIPEWESTFNTTMAKVKIAATGVSLARRRQPHVSRTGKIWAFLAWSSWGTRSTADVAGRFEPLETAHEPVRQAGKAMGYAAIPLNLVSTAGYVWHALKPGSKQ